ncbi:MAG TPA: response regulator [Ktedonobacteraceae bacterium]|nr:response regulator [Ktedonobacteraceae bacterium]
MANVTQEAAANKEVSAQVILVVEDEETISDFIVRVLEEETPYKALAATNAKQAFALVDTVKPDLLMLDYQLPGINGLELFDRLHAMQGLEAVPALMFSANAFSEKALRQALQERHITFLMKPFELDYLLQVVENLLTH